MLTFEEFFKKKKIDLDQLEKAEPALFAEFQLHYGLMGEKSFDHTKKYWFNNLRRLYHTADEPKVEKVKMENQIAEQTITESVSEQPEITKPKVGFTPKFKAAAKPPVEATPPVTEPPVTIAEETSATPAKLGFKPKFKTATAATPEDIKPVDLVNEEPAAETPATATPKLGFKPKFKTAAATTGDVQTPSAETPLPIAKGQADQEEKTDQPVSTQPKLGFKPKFKTAGASSVEKVDAKSEETITDKSEQIATDQETTVEVKPVTAPPKLGFKPKFKAAVKSVEEGAHTPEAGYEPAANETTEPEQSNEKPAYKPRFKMNNIKPKSEEGD